MAEGLNLFKHPFNETSVLSRTEYYSSDAAPDKSKETIIIEVINK